MRYKPRLLSIIIQIPNYEKTYFGYTEVSEQKRDCMCECVHTRTHETYIPEWITTATHGEHPSKASYISHKFTHRLEETFKFATFNSKCCCGPCTVALQGVYVSPNLTNQKKCLENFVTALNFVLIIVSITSATTSGTGTDILLPGKS